MIAFGDSWNNGVSVEEMSINNIGDENVDTIVVEPRYIDGNIKHSISGSGNSVYDYPVDFGEHNISMQYMFEKERGTFGKFGLSKFGYTCNDCDSSCFIEKDSLSKATDLQIMTAHKWMIGQILNEDCK